MTDLRHALRTMRRTPVFSAAVILTVALAIGVNTAIFSVVNAVILRPLPFDRPDGLVQVGEKNDALNLPNFGSSVLNYLSWKEQTQTLQLAAVGFATFALSGSGEPEQLTGNRVSSGLMTVLGLLPVAGRGFTADEDRPPAAWRHHSAGAGPKWMRSRRIAGQYPEMKDWSVRLTTFHDTFVSAQLQTALLVLLSAVVLVLLIAAANIANLLLARAAARQKEVAIRTVIGPAADG